VNISITSLHLEEKSKHQDYVNKKIKKLLKYHPKIEDIKVRLISQKAHRGQEKDYYCEITVHVPEKVLEIVDSQREIDKAIDKAIDRMKRALTKHKEKKLSKQHRQGVIGKFLRKFSS